MVFFSFLRKLLREHPLLFVGVAGLMAVLAITEGLVIALVIPLLQIAFEVEMMQEQGSLWTMLTQGTTQLFLLFGITPSLGTILLFIVGLFAVQGFVRLFQLYLQWKMLERHEASLIYDLLKDFLGARWLFFVNNKLGNLTNALAVESGRATAAFQFTLQALAHFFLILFYLSLSLFISWKITILGIGLGIFVSLFLKKFIGKMEQYGTESSRLNSEFNVAAVDMLGAAKMLKSSSTEKKALTHIDGIARQKVHLRFIALMSGSLIPSFYFPLMMAVLALIVYIAITYWFVGFTTIFIFFYIFYRLIPALSAFHGAYEQALNFIPAVDIVEAMRNTAREQQEKFGTRPYLGLAKEITFDNVSFAYEQGQPILDGITFTIKKGETVALVGPSGAGKTSIVDLLLGLLTPTKGNILIDGVPIQDYDVASVRRRIGYLSQDIFILHDTIRANLAWVAPHASEQEMNNALKAAYAYDFVEKMEHSIDTMVGDRGVKLSGGQRQRIALARLLLQNPDIIIFDEAMSALDSHSQAMIEKTIAEYLSSQTKIIISHRLSSLKYAGRIYLLEKGKIMQGGTLDEFMAGKGSFE